MPDMDEQGRPKRPLAADETTMLLGFEEYMRHNGHADLLRESVDGLTGE